MADQLPLPQYVGAPAGPSAIPIPQQNSPMLMPGGNPLLGLSSGIQQGASLGFQAQQIAALQQQRQIEMQQAQIQQQKNQEDFLTQAWGKIADLKNIPSYQNYLINAVQPLTQTVMGRYGLNVDMTHPDLVGNDPAQKEVTTIMASKMPAQEKATALKAVALKYPSQEDLDSRIASMAETLEGQSKVTYQKDAAGNQIGVTPQGQPTGQQLPGLPSGLSPLANTDIQKSTDDFMNNEQTKTSMKNLDLMNNLKAAIYSNNPAAIQNVKVNLAELGGLTGGRVSSNQVISESGSKALGAQAPRMIQKLLDGTLDQQDKQDFLGVIGTQTQANQTNLSNSMAGAVSGFTQLHPEVPSSQALGIIGGRVQPYLAPSTVKVIAPDGSRHLVNKEELQTALAQGYKLGQ